jgi:hypothetical protein
MAQEGTRKVQVSQLQNLEEKIRQRAYEIYESRGREGGHALDDWLSAEDEITRSNTRSAA